MIMYGSITYYIIFQEGLVSLVTQFHVLVSGSMLPVLPTILISVGRGVDMGVYSATNLMIHNKSFE